MPSPKLEKGLQLDPISPGAASPDGRSLGIIYCDKGNYEKAIEEFRIVADRPGSPEHFRIWGFDPQPGIPDLKTLHQRMHSEDRNREIELPREGGTGGYRLLARVQNRATRRNCETHPYGGPSGLRYERRGD